MKLFTLNLIRFITTLFLLTVLFRILLKITLDLQHFHTAFFIAALYGIAVFIAGFIFGRKDKQSLALYDIGFRFHLSTFVVCSIIGVIWFSLNFNSPYESVNSFAHQTYIWCAGVAIHYLIFLNTRKNSIKGLKKTDLFV